MTSLSLLGGTTVVVLWINTIDRNIAFKAAISSSAATTKFGVKL